MIKNTLKIVIVSITKIENEISELGIKYYIYDNNGIKSNYEEIQIITKKQLIKEINDNKVVKSVVVKTINNTEVNIIDNRYLRTDKNNIKEDNLGNLPP